MRKLLLMVLVVVLCVPTAMAQKPQFGVGAFGGLDIPVVQDDQAQGTSFGVKARVKLIPIVTFEPVLQFTQFGDPEFEGFTADLEGSKVTAYGVDATLGAPFAGPGFNIYGVVGAAIYNLKRDQTAQDESKLGWSGGLGFYLGFQQIGVDIRSKLHVIPGEDGGSKKSLSITGGVNYNFGMAM